MLEEMFEALPIILEGRVGQKLGLAPARGLVFAEPESGDEDGDAADGVEQAGDDEEPEGRKGDLGDGDVPAEALRDVLVVDEGGGGGGHADLAEGEGHGVEDGDAGRDGGGGGGLEEPVLAEADLDRGLHDVGFAWVAEGGVEAGDGAVDHGVLHVVDRGVAREGEGDPALARVDHLADRGRVGQHFVVCQTDAVDGRGGVEQEGIGLRLVGNGAGTAIDELVEGHIPPAGTLEPVDGGLVKVSDKDRGAVV